jgi:hypothetical protein
MFLQRVESKYHSYDLWRPIFLEEHKTPGGGFVLYCQELKLGGVGESKEAALRIFSENFNSLWIEHLTNVDIQQGLRDIVRQAETTPMEDGIKYWKAKYLEQRKVLNRIQGK